MDKEMLSENDKFKNFKKAVAANLLNCKDYNELKLRITSVHLAFTLVEVLERVSLISEKTKADSEDKNVN